MVFHMTVSEHIEIAEAYILETTKKILTKPLNH